MNSHHKVSPAAMFFGDAMANLCGAIDVLLFLIVRPQLLLFPRPEPDIEFTPQGASSAISPDIEMFQHGPASTSAALLVDGGSRNSTGQSRVSSRRLSDDI